MLPDPTRQRVIVMTGTYSDNERVYLGRSTDRSKWMIPPDDIEDVVALRF